MPWPWLPEHLVGGFSIAMIREERERDIYIYIVKFHQSEAISFGCFCNVCLCCILTECCWTVRLVLEDFSLGISNDWG
jgi:hypothetical protein